MSFRGRNSGMENPNKIELGEPRRFGGGDDMGNDDDRRFDAGRGPRGRGGGFGRGRRPSPPPGRGNPRDFPPYGRDEPPMMRDRSPFRGGNDRFPDRFKKDDGRPYDDRDRFMERDLGPKSRFDGNRGDDMRPMGGAFPPPAAGPRFDGFPKPNECEIIAISRHQQIYAENVEAKIKNMGILVDVLFLKDEALLTQTIDDISRRGSLYAVVIGPSNEAHRSVTVNILHGTPQEHRNMPLEDSMKLIARNFHDFIRSQREHMEKEREKRGPYLGDVSADKEVQFVLRMLADGRHISIGEIDIVIKYLTQRRDKMEHGIKGVDAAKPEPATFKPKEEPVTTTAQKEMDLQKRIMSIMNQTEAEEPAPKPAAKALPSYSTTGSASPSTFLNFDSPSVKKALDSLMQSGPSLLKNISAGAAMSPVPTQGGAAAAQAAGPGSMPPVGADATGRYANDDRDFGGPNFGGPPRMGNDGHMGGHPPGGNFPNQFNRFPGPGQQGNFPYNPGMQRGGFGGGPPRRY